MSSENNPSTWNEWGKYVIAELKRLAGCVMEQASELRRLELTVHKHDIDIAVMKTDFDQDLLHEVHNNTKQITIIQAKAAVYGAVAGFAMSIVVALIIKFVGGLF